MYAHVKVSKSWITLQDIRFMNSVNFDCLFSVGSHTKCMAPTMSAQYVSWDIGTGIAQKLKPLGIENRVVIYVHTECNSSANETGFQCTMNTAKSKRNFRIFQQVPDETITFDVRICEHELIALPRAVSQNVCFVIPLFTVFDHNSSCKLLLLSFESEVIHRICQTFKCRCFVSAFIVASW